MRTSETATIRAMVIEDMDIIKIILESENDNIVLKHHIIDMLHVKYPLEYSSTNPRWMNDLLEIAYSKIDFSAIADELLQLVQSEELKAWYNILIDSSKITEEQRQHVKEAIFCKF